MRGDVPLEVTQLKSVGPRDEIADGHLRYFCYRAIADTNVQRLGLKFGAVTLRTFLRGLILSQKNPDVLLVLLLLESDEKRKNPLVAARLCREQQFSVLGLES